MRSKLRRGLVGLGVVVGIATCSDGDDSAADADAGRDADWSRFCPPADAGAAATAQCPPPSNTLAGLADDVRADGGAAFIGWMVAGSLEEAAPAISIYVVVEPDYRVTAARVRATIGVRDPLGATLPESFVTRALSGAQWWSTADGTCAPELFEAYGPPYGRCEDANHQRLTFEGEERLVFVSPPEEEGAEWRLAWHTTVSDGVASGDGTSDLQDIAIDDLRIE